MVLKSKVSVKFISEEKTQNNVKLLTGSLQEN